MTAFDEETGQNIPELTEFGGWDVAVRFHEFRKQLKKPEAVRRLQRVSAEAILSRAREVLGSVSSPTEMKSANLAEAPPQAQGSEIDLDDTIENEPLALKKGDLRAADIWIRYREHRRQAVILSVDTSLSMTGEKLALTGVALAVVLLQFPNDPIGVVAFENEATVLKRPEERIRARDLIERFLGVPAQGYTHLEDGLKSALKLVRAVENTSRIRPSTVLLSDGKYTAGSDPSYLAHRFPHLVVLKMGRERASLSLCRELARKGGGAVREVPELESLPSAMYGVVKDLLRGFSRR
ncbi:MAG: hypothetical protein A2X94_09740 [Bdellovibrionales bacterium GWB1_55_8]|nr:MAG: hypothetical protein A2X94_09740 [Bdellovibrionales bacterium GWB1_55_8]